MKIQDGICELENDNNERKTYWFAIMVLSLSAIIFVTAELLPIGVLQEIGDTYQQPVGKIGLIITGYAWVVAFSAVFVTSLFLKIERRILIIILLISFGLSNIIVSLSPNLTVLYIGRVIGAFSHGIFWSIVGPLAVRLSSEGGKAKATALVFGGIAIASVGVVPLATLVSQRIGWELSFFILGLSALVISIFVRLSMPVVQHDKAQKTTSLMRVITQPYLRRTFPVTALALCGNYCAFTYIGPLVETQIGISHAKFPLFLLLFGVAGVVGNFISGFVSDRNLVLATRITLLLMALSVGSMGLLTDISLVAGIFMMALWGAGICIITVTLQSLVLNLAEDSGERPSSVHVAMFNIGIGSGAFLGGVLLDGFNIATVALTASGLMLLALVLLLPKILLTHQK
ncbi:MFS transporter [Serratia aquatilis]|uniref:MFS transporter n=1 Tax=Serratia aquatilis TaxID=1737515 RepID=A0ABV6ED77_9GAMM